MFRIYYCRDKAHRVTLTDEGYTLEVKDCSACMKLAGLSEEPAAHAVGSRYCQMSDQEREALVVPFGPRARKFRNAKDIDKRLEIFKKKNPILQEGYKSKSLMQIAKEQGKR